MTGIEVRPADESDLEAIAAIYVDAAQAGWAHIFDQPSLKAMEPPVDRLRAELASIDQHRQLLVAESEGRVIAFAVLRPSQDEDTDGIQVGELTRPVLLRSSGLGPRGRPNAVGRGVRDPS
jgi:hypothetical protein